MIHVYIPSRDRYQREYIEKGPAGILTEAGIPFTYVVPHDQHHLYSGMVPCVARPPSVTNIGMARHYIGSVAEYNKQEKFIMFDDDLRFFTRIVEFDTKLRKSEPEDIMEMLTYVEMGLDAYGQIGISARQGNNHAGDGDKPHHKDSTRTNGCTAYRTGVFMQLEHNRLLFMEDFDVTLQMLRKGIPNCAFYHWAYDQAMTNAPGGCSTYRTHQNHEESAHKLAELHPGLVRLRQKANKTGGEFGTRTEVTVMWKNAFKEGQKNAG